MMKPMLLTALLPVAVLFSCHPTTDTLPPVPLGCVFAFSDCFPVDPCEDEDFSLHELLVIEGEGLYLETSEPDAVVIQLGFSAPGSGYALPPELLAAQYHPPGSPHFIVIPVEGQHPFWAAFNLAASNGTVRWSGRIEYPCRRGPKPALY